MSKKSKSKKKNINKSNSKNNTKKHCNKFKIIIPIVLIILTIGIITFAVILNVNSDTAKINNELCNNYWTPVSAKNASDDEVEMSQVYNTEYTSYKGSLEFNDDGTFNFWMSPGSPDDGTHSGRYDVADNNTLNMYFDDGTNTNFGIKYVDGKVIGIEVNYDNYKVTFASVE